MNKILLAILAIAAGYFVWFVYTYNHLTTTFIYIFAFLVLFLVLVLMIRYLELYWRVTVFKHLARRYSLAHQYSYSVWGSEKTFNTLGGMINGKRVKVSDNIHLNLAIYANYLVTRVYIGDQIVADGSKRWFKHTFSQSSIDQILRNIK
ncbi:MAG: hypothetical protein V4526_02595 [Patescibacteria group bacterium]